MKHLLIFLVSFIVLLAACSLAESTDALYGRYDYLVYDRSPDLMFDIGRASKSGVYDVHITKHQGKDVDFQVELTVEDVDDGTLSQLTGSLDGTIDIHGLYSYGSTYPSRLELFVVNSKAKHNVTNNDTRTILGNLETPIERRIPLFQSVSKIHYRSAEVEFDLLLPEPSGDLLIENFIRNDRLVCSSSSFDQASLGAEPFLTLVGAFVGSTDLHGNLPSSSTYWATAIPTTIGPTVFVSNDTLLTALGKCIEAISYRFP